MYFTKQRQQAFTSYLADSHSWYKHLSLLKGGQFIITIDKDAGENFPTEHPKLPFGNSKEYYQKVFGQLIFWWRNDGELLFYADGKQKGEYLEDIQQKYTDHICLQLFPYLSNDFREAIDHHKTAFLLIKEGAVHPQKDILNTVLECNEQGQYLWNHVLSEDEEDLICDDIKDEENENLCLYYATKEKITDLVDKLRQIELIKIEAAIEELKLLLTNNK